jgi:hypothetical protein
LRLWDNIGKCGGASDATNDNKIWRMRTASWISKAQRPHVHTEKYVIPIPFPPQQWFRERASVLRYTHIACFIIHFDEHDLQTVSTAGQITHCYIILFSSLQKVSTLMTEKLPVHTKSATVTAHMEHTTYHTR